MKIMLTALLILTSCAATAEIYKWTDKNGVVHYEDQQPEKNNGAATKVDTMVLQPVQPLEQTNTTTGNPGNKYEELLTQWLNQAAILKADILRRLDQWRNTTPVVSNETIAEHQNTTTNKTPAKPDNVVEIYTTAWCGVCKKAKRWLNDRGITYKEYDIEKNSQAAIRMRKLGGGNGVPFTVINGETFQGFDPNAYQAALRK